MNETKELIEQFIKDQNYTKEQFEYDKRVFDRHITVCPICGKLTFDLDYICNNCGWEYDEYMENNILDDKNMFVMKLLYYFITEKNYNPIILQGVENEIWLENMDEDYRVVRIVSGKIINDEQ